MAAKRDTSKSTYFVIGAPSVSACAAHSANGLILKESFPNRKTWTICEHLSTPEKVMAYHREASPILIVHGFVLCQECNNRNILIGQDGFEKMLRSSVPQDDSFFQKFIMKRSVPDSYCYWAKLREGTDDHADSHKHVCIHLNTSEKLNSHYASRQKLFWHQDSLICANCLDEINNGNMDAVENSSLKLQDAVFTEQVVGPLCLMNNEHFGFK
jgi:hypothetical protein